MELLALLLATAVSLSVCAPQPPSPVPSSGTAVYSTAEPETPPDAPCRGISDGAQDMVATALREAALPYRERSEDPAGSNRCKYNDAYYGREAIDHTGADGQYISQYNWCAVFVWWCAEQCGFTETGLFPKTSNVANLYYYLTRDRGFNSYKGKEITQLGGTGYTAQPGDIFCFSLEHTGIVTGVGDGYIDVTQGNTYDTVLTLRYDAESLRQIWSLRHGYIIHVEYPPRADRQVLNYLRTEVGLNRAAAIGVLTNMLCASGLDPAAESTGGETFGLCSWCGPRREALETFCAENAYPLTALESQLAFVKYELTHDYAAVLETVLSCPDSPAGCSEAAQRWCELYENPPAPEEALLRAGLAKHAYSTRFKEDIATGSGEYNLSQQR